MTMKHEKTICQILANLPEQRKSQPATMSKSSGKWRTKNWAEYYEDIQKIATALSKSGIKKGDRIAIMANTRYEWSVFDYAILGLGGVTVPIYQNVISDDLLYILNDCEAQILIVENRHMLKNFLAIREKCPTVQRVITIENVSVDEFPTQSFEQLINSRNLTDQDRVAFEQSCNDTKFTDTATLIYTSGTTGSPKGVVLTHMQIISEVGEAFPAMTATASDVNLSFLPYAHVLGRIEHWGHVYIGFTMAYAESIERIKHNLLEVKPTFMIAVPRIFEKIYSAIWAQAETQPMKLKVFRWSLAVALKMGDYRLRKSLPPLTLLAEYQLAKKLVLQNVKAAFGGRLRFAVSGGAPLARDIALFFHACDVLILEGYGLSETTAAICVNRPYDYRFGSVGKPIGDVELKIAEDGEILVRSKKVMREYYQNPQATKEAFTGEWFHTGDIGEILDSGDLRITDRKKDLIKTAGGKYVAPQKLEGLLKVHPFISNVLIHGDQKKYIVALLTLDRQYLLKYAKDNRISYADFIELTKNQRIQEMVRDAVAECNSHLASFESIKKYQVLPDDFTVESGELTPSLKVKRKVLDIKYKERIESMY